MAKIKQVNNLTIRRIRVWSTFPPFEVVSPEGRVLEEFQTLEAAVAWAEKTTDFLKRKPKEALNDV